jgi:hypothetical protein
MSDLCRLNYRCPKTRRSRRGIYWSKELSALKLLRRDNGNAVADVLDLPSGAELQGFGHFFDTRSLLVAFDGFFYVVFQEDLHRAQSA